MIKEGGHRQHKISKITLLETYLTLKVDKQINDKERIMAARENEELMAFIESLISWTSSKTLFLKEYRITSDNMAIFICNSFKCDIYDEHYSVSSLTFMKYGEYKTSKGILKVYIYILGTVTTCLWPFESKVSQLLKANFIFFLKYTWD